MTTVREHVPLSAYTTLRLGGPARSFAEAASDAEIVAQVRAADGRGEPLLVLGGGSNLVVADEGFRGTVVKIASSGIELGEPGNGEPGPGGPGGPGGEGDGPAVTVTVAAGEDWDGFVSWSLREGLSGLECLSGIPGLAGATPIQNVGAYGQEVSQVITSVRAYDRVGRATVPLPNADCGFGYRTSAFKREAAQAGGVTGRFVVLAVTFRLRRSALSQPVRYGELARSLGVGEGDRAPLGQVRAQVLALRRSKGMVLDPADPDTRSAGSFFTNPVVTQAQFAALQQVVAATGGPGARIPRYPAPGGMVKVSAAWLIEQAGFGKGYPGGGGSVSAGPRISAKHTLALVNPGGATAASLLALAGEIRDGVRKAFGIELTPEPVLTAGWR
jgi:UDP-N-acetylmuramate dehydrogenase